MNEITLVASAINFIRLGCIADKCLKNPELSLSSLEDLCESARRDFHLFPDGTYEHFNRARLALSGYRSALGRNPGDPRVLLETAITEMVRKASQSSAAWLFGLGVVLGEAKVGSEAQFLARLRDHIGIVPTSLRRFLGRSILIEPLHGAAFTSARLQGVPTVLPGSPVLVLNPT